MRRWSSRLPVEVERNAHELKGLGRLYRFDLSSLMIKPSSLETAMSQLVQAAQLSLEDVMVAQSSRY